MKEITYRYATSLFCRVCGQADPIESDRDSRVFTAVHVDHAPQMVLAGEQQSWTKAERPSHVLIVGMCDPVFDAVRDLGNPTVSEIAAKVNMGAGTIRSHLKRLGNFVMALDGRPTRYIANT